MLSNHPIFVVLLVAVLAPVLAEVPIGVRIPVIVFEVLLGILIGPHVLGLVDPTRVGGFLETMQAVGMAAVLFMAGMELNFEQIRGRPLWLATGGWILSVAIALLAIVLLRLVPGAKAPLFVAVALTTTMLGALVPILRDSGQLESAYGKLVIAAGTVGEVSPIVATSLLLSDQYTTWQEFGLLLAFLALVGGAAVLGTAARPPGVLMFLSRTLHASSQLPVRLALLILAGLVVLAVEFGFEGVLGSFAAGMVVGLATRGKAGEPFRVKIDAVSFGFLTPFFFVGTGVGFNLGALAGDSVTLLLMPAFLLLLLLARGAPVLLYRNDLTRSQRLPFALSSSVASLGLVVVISQVGLRAGRLNADVAQALVAAALISLLVFPTLVGVLSSRRTSSSSDSGPA